ncbi:MAG: aminoglycoside phosphotransferase family protein [Anaerolineae bacterium]|nr:aminoglycoside phosphotransferase family protein [Anaerolineae bacterium]
MGVNASALGLQWMPRLGKSWRRWINRHALRRVVGMAPAILRALPPLPGLPGPETWRVGRVDWTLTDVIVLAVGPEGSAPAAIIKLPCSATGTESLRCQAAILSMLRADERLTAWLALTPEPLASGQLDGQPYFVERALPGIEARLLLHDRAADERLHRAALRTITQLHRRTAAEVRVDAEALERWVERPMGALLRVVVNRPRARLHEGALERVREELHAFLTGQTLTVSWIHGDFWASNLLVRADGSAINGIVDWDRAAPQELPAFDILHLLLQRRKLLAGQREMGPTVSGLLRGEGWTPMERVLLTESVVAPAVETESGHALLLLYWLHYLALYLAQNPARAWDEGWVSKNLEVVLQCL